MYPFISPVGREEYVSPSSKEDLTHSFGIFNHAKDKYTSAGQILPPSYLSECPVDGFSKVKMPSFAQMNL